LGTNGQGIQKLDVYEKAVLDLLNFGPKQRKWLVEQLCPKIMSKRKMQKTLDSLKQAERIKRVYRSIEGRQTTWYVLPDHEYLLNVDEGRMLSVMDRLKKLLFRPATVDELAVETGVAPAVAEKLAYKLAAQAGWFNPSPELIAHAREKLGEILVCAARIKQNVFSDADLNQVYRDDPEIMVEAKRFLREHPEMVPTLQPDQHLHPVAWCLSWPDEALKYLGSSHKPKPRLIPSAGAYFIQH
jgi:hypothetical protein